MRLLLSILLMASITVTTAQQRHFLYLQSDSQQAFYLKMEGVIYSSSVSGFLILPRLQPGLVEFSIGFPKAQWPEHQFQIELQAADKGLLLKNLPDKGWILQDFQTAVITEGKRKELSSTSAQQPEKVKTNDGFAVTLANAVGDQGIREVELVTKTASAIPPVLQTQAPVEQSVPTQDSSSLTQSPGSPVPDSSVFTSRVEKLGETRLPGYTGLLFLDQTGSDRDTVDVSFEHPPADSTIMKDSSILQADTVRLVVTEKDTSLLSDSRSNAGEVKIADYMHMPASSLPDRSDCKTLATEKDMALIRKKAISLGTDSVMVNYFVRELKSKCYTVAMVQALGFAFVSDASRFSFFQEAYPWVLDPSSYPQLERLFVSEPFLSQFKKLINPE